MTSDTESSARALAVAEVVAGGVLEDVALKYGVSVAKLRRWVPEGDVEQPSPTRSVPNHPTIIDVAERAQVSKSVVSRALRGQYGVSEQARDRVRRAAAELGFVMNAAAQRLSAKRTNTLGVLIRDASSPMYGELQSALQTEGRSRGQRIFITSGALDHDDEVQALEDLIALRVDGLVVCSGRLAADKIARFASDLPTVVAGRVELDGRLNSAYGDEDAGADELVEHLAELGHRCVAVLDPSEDESPVMHRRAQHFLAALEGRGLQPVSVAVRGSEAPLHGLIPAEATAVMCPNDRYAAALLSSRDASDTRAVTGFDGLGGLGHELVGITTWVQPVASIAQAALDLVLAPLATTSHVALPGRLRPSRSTLNAPRPE